MIDLTVSVKNVPRCGFRTLKLARWNKDEIIKFSENFTMERMAADYLSTIIFLSTRNYEFIEVQL